MDPTSTHLPILDSLFRQREIASVLEFGCGLFSTRKFVECGCKVTSIEMQSREWFDRVKAALPTVDLHLALGAMEWKKLIPELADRYDMIFVDGHKDSRPDCMTWAKDRTDLIVAHDTEHPVYQWERADMRGFSVQVFDVVRPWTTVWTRS